MQKTRTRIAVRLGVTERSSTGKRGLIYGRVSTDDQRGNYSIPTQIADCLKHAQARGYTLVGERFVNPETGLDQAASDSAIRAYVDDYTSRELSRPSLDAALQYAEQQGFDVLIVHALDRLARDPYIRQTLEREFNRYGVQVEYVLGDYAETAEGEVRKDLDATFAKWENAKRVERMNRGKIGKARSGRYVTGVGVYGYVPDASSLCGLAVDAEKAEVVRWIFDQIANRAGALRGVATQLNAKGIPSPRNKRWSYVTIGMIVRNETYTGTHYYNVRKLLQNGRVVIRDRSEWVPINVPPIVDRETWEAAQRQLKDNARLRRRPPKRFYLLSGMVQCADCGHAYVAQAEGEKYRVYYHRARDGACRNHQLFATKLETRVWAEIVAAIKHPEQTRRGYTDAKAEYDLLTQRQRNHLANLQANLAKQTRRKERLDRMYSDPDLSMTKDEYLKQKTEIDAERKGLEERIEVVNAELAKFQAPVSLETLDAFIAEINRLLDNQIDPSPEKRRQLLQILHVKVLVSRQGEPDVTGWFRPGLSSSTY